MTFRDLSWLVASRFVLHWVVLCASVLVMPHSSVPQQASSQHPRGHHTATTATQLRKTRKICYLIKWVGYNELEDITSEPPANVKVPKVETPLLDQGKDDFEVSSAT